jgi:hypothetical protein
MRKLIDAYCKRQGLQVSSVRFLFKGEPLNPEDTADSMGKEDVTMGMEDGDRIDVMHLQTGDIGVFIADGEMLNDPTAIAASLGLVYQLHLSSFRQHNARCLLCPGSFRTRACWWINPTFSLASSHALSRFVSVPPKPTLL